MLSSYCKTEWLQGFERAELGVVPAGEGTRAQTLHSELLELSGHLCHFTQRVFTEHPVDKLGLPGLRAGCVEGNQGHRRCLHGLTAEWDVTNSSEQIIVRIVTLF